MYTHTPHFQKCPIRYYSSTPKVIVKYGPCIAWSGITYRPNKVAPLLERLEQNGIKATLETSTIRDQLQIYVGNEVVFTGTVNEVSSLYGGETVIQKAVNAVKSKLEKWI